jgi:pimeloyl-ACP methyl ester carboxylesterase
VRAIFAKPLDWFIIQLARRHASSHLSPPLAEGQLRQWLHNSGLLSNSQRPQIECRLHGDRRLVYPSPVKTPYPENNIVHGRLFSASANWREHPTAILLHGWNASLCYRYIFPLLAARLRRVQVNTAMIELPYHMQRRPRNGNVTDFISSDLERTVEAACQAVSDIRALCDWLASHGVPSVGLWGFSLGAWLAGLVARSEPDLSFSVLTTPIARIDRVITDLPFCEPVRRSLGNGGPELRDLNLASRPPRIGPERILIMESVHDLFAPMETIEELWHAWGKPEIWRMHHGHISAMASVSAMERAVHWISSKTQAAAI